MDRRCFRFLKLFIRWLGDAVGRNEIDFLSVSVESLMIFLEESNSFLEEEVVFVGMLSERVESVEIRFA
jgi:hydrogenase maturation factor HypE